MNKTNWMAALAITVALPSCARSGNPARVATGYISHVVCSYVFVSGLDADRVGAEEIAANPAFRGFNWALSFRVDGQKREVIARTIGGLESRAVYREGLGCLNVNGPVPDAAPRAGGEAPVPVLLPEIAGAAVVEPRSPDLKLALDAAFAETPGASLRRTHAIVIVHDGRVLAERYAPGFSIETPVHGWSATKSINNALLGILVRQGKLKMEEPAPVVAWQSPGDPRRAITPDQMLRMLSGLDLGDSLSASLSSAWDTSSRGMFNEPDVAGFAESAQPVAAPGSEWKYANGNPAILARLIRDSLGGEDVPSFARRELFGPLGMRHATLEMDANGTPIAGAFFFATPREWARFGLLFLNDGVVGSKRILPEGWVRYSTTPTPAAFVGYGAGWWINQGESQGARFRRAHGMPAESFMAQGVYGQTVVIVPSERLVICRFGTTYDLRMAMEDVSLLTASTIAVLHPPAPGASAAPRSP